MKESLRDEVIAHSGDGVAQVVKQRTSKISNPVVSTEEVAEALDIPEEEAFDRLEEDPNVSGKLVGESHGWW
ncbi:hypothetical protein [Natronococcus sp. A-GB7]|uniref:hypothetical protein n=1 Tax=Natronococcus sp. A-GB7 TaxID=3037649 RepID=UPI00241C2386|nr:hypothetical protein [Natronococcus sp. A-GB7]MDG5821928.1 hypothetical protein [Natronococcus sp. A-GB7]